MYFPSKLGGAGRGRPKINVAGGALVSFNLKSSFLGCPQGREFFSEISEAKAKAKALFKRLRDGIGAGSKSQSQGKGFNLMP